jgi:hypothetical protein
MSVVAKGVVSARIVESDEESEAGSGGHKSGSESEKNKSGSESE